MSEFLNNYINMINYVFPYYSTKTSVDALQGPKNIESLLPDIINNPTSISDVLNSAVAYQASSYQGSDNAIIEIPFENFYDQNIQTHFRLSFYQDPFMSILLDSSFSLTDKTRWFIFVEKQKYIPSISIGDVYPYKTIDLSPVPFPSNGLTIEKDKGDSVYFAPNILPANLHINALEYENSYEKYDFLCGVAYYVKAEAYINGQFYFINNFIYKTRCEKIRSEFDDENIDKFNWVSSANGSIDTIVSQSTNNAISPSISAIHTNKDILYVAWKDFKRRSEKDYDYSKNSLFSISNDFYDNSPIISYGYWNITDNIWHTSGQFSYDWIVEDSDGHMLTSPMDVDCLYDIYGNISFVVAKNLIDSCQIDIVTKNILISDVSDNYYRDILNDDIITYDAIYPYVRVVNKYVDSIATLSKNVAVPVVVSNFIELDIGGIDDARAVRIKNDDDPQWSQWIAIDNNLPSDIINEGYIYSSSSFYDINYGKYNANEVFKAVSIENNRIICPWILSSNNGVKSIWVQLLSSSGLTQISLLNVITNVPETKYKLNIYHLSDPYDPYGTVLQYNGKNILKSGYNSVQITIYDFDVYIKEFTFMTLYEKYNKFLILDGSDIYIKISDNIKLTLLQKGFVVYNGINFGEETAEERKKGIFKAIFYIDNTDEVWIQDGDAILNIVIPTMNNIYTIGSFTDSLNQYKDISLYNYAKTEQMDKIDIIGSALKQQRQTKIVNSQNLYDYYNGDDAFFNFGDESYWSH